jgi:simple sugar transport system ATP-binding protein
MEFTEVVLKATSVDISLTHEEHDVMTTSSQPHGRAFLEVKNLTKRFAGVHALRGVSFQIEAGKIYHLLGENGCGKSTLIKIISGAQPQSDGNVFINGIEQLSLNPLQALKLGIETVYQDLSLLPNLSVAQNVALGTQLVARNGKLLSILDLEAIKKIASSALAAVALPFDREFLDTPVHLLPIATRQLVAIARAIASDARLVIMDEPTTALTQKEIDNLINVVNTLRDRGVAIIFVTHKLDECYLIGGEVIVFRDGQKIAQDSINNYTKQDITRLMTGREIGTDRLRTNTQRSREVTLKAIGLTRSKNYQQVTFDLHEGEILGVTGLLDSGRNELALALSGIRPAHSGSIELNGIALALKSPRDAIDAGIAYVPEDRLTDGLFLDKPIQDNIIVASLDRLRNKLGFVDKQKTTALAKKIVSDLQIATPDVERPVQALSGGNQQRVLIGRWLAIDPKVLILHGPTVGVDVGSKETIYRIIQGLSDDGVSVILISDDLPELLQNCDRILIMKKGRLLSCVDAEQLDETILYKQLVS